MITGARYARLKNTPARPEPMEMAHIQLVSWSGESPAKLAAWKMMAAGPP